MKKTIVLFILTFLFVQVSLGQITKHALFLGNSYTGVNNLPQIVHDVATSMGDSLIFDSNTPGGYTFQNHSADVNSINKIMVGTWDYVVLQEQSQLPSFPIDQVDSFVFPYAHYLDSMIHAYNSCASTLFYMTWGRKNGDASNCATWPPVCTYSGMDSLLNMRYMMLADSNHALVSPVGAVWNYIRQNYPSLELYQADESHPSVAGSFAAACCFYTSMYRKNPMNIPYNYTLASSDADIIRAAVKVVVYDSLLNWHIGQYDPNANFTFSVGNHDSVSFSNLSSNAINYLWQFGDGDTSTLANPIHGYGSGGLDTVLLIAYHCSYSDTISIIVNTSSSGIDYLNHNDKIFIYPNPVTDKLKIEMIDSKLRQIYLTDILGQVQTACYTLQDKTIILNLSSFADGIYFIRIVEDNAVRTYKIIKQ
ncbi:MAG: T9SS type A sorting domain-containing protein [Bacteroidota bacterium]